MLQPFIASLVEQVVASPEDPLLAGEGTSVPEGDRCESIFGLYAAGVPLGEIAQILGCSVLTAQDDIEQARGRRPVLANHDDRVAWELHRAVVDRLRDDPAPVVTAARVRLEELRAGDDGGQATREAAQFSEWGRLLEGDTESLIDSMLAPGEQGAQLRSATPFADVLTTDERLAAIRKASVPAPL
ncbi:hypothetical protein [Sinomonas humi]|uniref:Uncharacterized protein n=1 Tax=Sinomonas humi TaxID=1338436 RepID=A0A0B2ARN4_9MICC|nr:hypothetical protein [Sinomonas humi]KHL04513.1 hypothetical protein LK10_04775 [Sinomonas humi]